MSARSIWKHRRDELYQRGVTFYLFLVLAERAILEARWEAQRAFDARVREAYANHCDAANDLAVALAA